MKKIIRILSILLFLVVASAGIAWKLSDNKAKIEANAEAAQVRNTTVLVTTTKAAPRVLGGDFTLTGSLKPYRELALMSEVSGRLKEVSFSNGSNVAAGKVLATVDNDLISQQLDITRINLAKAQRDAERLANLAATGGVSQQQLEDARNGVQNLQAQIASLEKQLSMTRIIAPFAGVITNKTAEPGAFVSPGMKLADLVQTSKLYMQIYALEEQVPLLKTGQTATVVVDLYPEQPLTGRITFIDVKADPSKRYLVELELTNPGNLRADMNGTVTFSRPSEKPVLSIPRDCLVGSIRDARVYLVRDGKAILQPVTTGQINDQYVEITGGLTEADVIVLSGQINLSDGAAVNIQE